MNKPLTIFLCGAMLAWSASAQNAPSITGQLLFYGQVNTRAASGPLAQGHRLSPATLDAAATSAVQADASARLQWPGVEAAVSALGNKDSNTPGTARLRLDELFHTRDINAMTRLTVGKRIVSWDVGYAFRPNDWLQDEARRALAPHLLEGRPLLMLESYSAHAAWTLAAAHTAGRAPDSHPHAPAQTVLAGRYYQHAGAADLYGFAGIGSRSRATAGAAFSWVLDEALELHGSYRWSQRVRGLAAPAAHAPVLAAASPYAEVWRGPAHQLLIGGTWTAENKLSLIVEGWIDGNAPSNHFWSQWAERNAALNTAAAQGAPPPAVAGNYGWQAAPLAYGPLRRANLYARLSWQHGDWEPAIDALYMPADGGLILTTGLTWSGQRVKLTSGIRLSRGPCASLAAQLPVRTLVWAGLSMPF
jgi:hypothetical protein